MTEVQWLILTAVCLMVAAAVSAFVYALGSMWIVQTHPADVLERLEILEKRYERLREGMKRAGHWKSQYDIDSPPDHLKVNA